MSPIPFVLLSNIGSGWLITGMMVREITFQSLLKCIGTTGNVEYFLGAVERTSVKVRVALERHADEVRNRVL